MGFVSTNVFNYLTQRVTPVYIIVNDVLIEDPVVIHRKIVDQYKNDNIQCIILNEGKDICLHFNHEMLISQNDYFSELYREVFKFTLAFCISNVGFINRTVLRFPNEHYPVEMIVPFSESDRHNKIMILVDSNDIETSDKMSIEIKFYPKSYTIETENTLYKIISKWIEAMNRRGIADEHISTSLDSLMITKMSSGIKFNIESTPLIKYILWDLYLRLRSNFNKFSRPRAIVFHRQ